MVFEHLCVRRRGNQQCSFKRQCSLQQNIVGNALGELVDTVRRGRGDDKDFTLLAKVNVVECTAPAFTLFGQYRVAGKRFKGQCRDKTLRRRGHDHMHIRTCLDKETRCITRFVGRDTACNTKKDFSARKIDLHYFTPKNL